MSRVYCPNCGSEVKLPETSSIGIGMTISKETKGDYALPLEVTRNNNVTNQNYKEKKENDNMNNNMNNMNGFDMEALAKMVAAQLSGIATQTVEQNAPKVANVATELRSTNVVDKNHWAENSQFYGKEICGYAFNPYMIRRFLPAQFEELMRKYNNNVHRGITREYSYMYAINYTLEEVRKLAMLEKRDKIAFDERKRVFDLRSCQAIFKKYIEDVITHLNQNMTEFMWYNKVGKKYSLGIKGYGWIKEAGVVAERIENHKVVKYMEISPEFQKVFDDLNKLKDNLRWIRNYKDLYELMVKKTQIKVPAERVKPAVFMDCFIKAGSYYTLKQMLMFNENICFKGERGRYAVQKLRGFLERGYEGYKIYAMLKEVKGIR